ncbi:PREDICTED: lysoplasmalogenase-like protein TMEM86A [Amphimedon queenslandica]|uniref:lysoplasmalogenase n=1 Tax=Amphimedon queenslandica TaxID=400682 RepID=A0A1X7T1N2_AMPQE|nr:PREDICTED: lysoplasmalogenase-like protein TMEM86A [Amphimedon queenslandica]|eukprot:XP_011408398.1 PREDICTED: lysoplasmalogenase-like protein TMEM86A [Amphimedon queenslandica]
METVHQIASLVYGALSCFYLFFIIRSNYRHLKALFKILPLFALLFCLVSVSMKYAAPFNIKSPYYVQKLSMVTMGVIFSLMGDVYLCYESLFMYGIVSFAFAQSFYVFTFSDEGFLFTQVRSPELISLLCIGCISIAIYTYLVSKMTCGLSVLALLYTILITLMAWSAVMQVQKYVSVVTLAGGVGACLFYVSDVTISMNLWRGPLSSFLAKEFVMITYYAAQLLIVFSHIYND